MKKTTSERLKQIMNERALRQVDILDLIKPFAEKYGVRFARNDLSQYVSGKVEPSQEKLTILSMALGVSEPWLMGYDITNEEETSISQDHFKDPQEAIKFLLEQNVIMALNGVDITKLSEEEQIQMANEVLDLINMVSYKYKK